MQCSRCQKPSNAVVGRGGTAVVVLHVVFWIVGIAQTSLALLSLNRIILIGCKKSVFLIPLVLLLGCLFIFLAIMLYTAGVNVNKVSVEVILVLVSVVDVRTVRRGLFRAVIDITNTGQLELLALITIVCVGEVIACIEGTVELHVTLREVLLLARDAVHVVVAHGKGVRSHLIVRSLISTCCA